MKKLIFFLVLILPVHEYERDMAKMVIFLKSEKNTIIQIANTSNADFREALSIVFPELIRWSAFQDYFEITSNEILYVQKGKNACDLSIGHFQMRPSFIEQLEEFISKNKSLDYLNYVILKSTSEKNNREIRIQRLKQFSWQLRYAHVFWLVAQEKFKNRKFSCPEDRIQFYATAYNHGFLKPETDIEKWEHKAFFPHGVKYKGKQVCYADLAIEFYKKYSSSLEFE